MARIIRANTACAVTALAGCGATAWLALYGYGWSDYETEARPAVDALVHGHFSRFVQLAPAYGGSLIERAPFAFLPRLWHGGDLATYRMLALPCLLASAILGVWLFARMRVADGPRLARATALVLCVANPVTLPVLELGHPEELLGGCLMVGAVLVASGAGTRSRALLAGALLGLAVANKESALVAVGPVMLALPAGLRVRCLIAATVVAGGVLAPLLASSTFLTNTTETASHASPIFQPWQVWWFFGHHGPLVHGLFGAPKPGYRVGPQWTGNVARPLVLFASLAVAGALWLARGRLERRDALLALALVLLLRCVLDTWDSVPYTLPVVLALLAWETTDAPKRAPLRTLLVTVLVWTSFEWLPSNASADAQAAFFLCWSLALAGWLAWRLRANGVPAGGRRAHARARRQAAVGTRLATSSPMTLRRRLSALHANALVSSIV